MTSHTSIRQLFHGILCISIAMFIFMYNSLERYFEQKEKINLAALDAFELNFGRAPVSDDFVPIRELDADLQPSVIINAPTFEVDESDADNEEVKQQLKLAEEKSLPWEEIRAEIARQKSATPKMMKETNVKMFWEEDKDSPVPQKKLNQNDKSDKVSWEEPEHIIQKVDLGPAPVYNATQLARFVHFDFKGAPPKLYYLERMIKNVTQWGATGLLLEYENTFPYTDDFKVLRGRFSYKEEDVKKINQLASDQNLDIILYISLFDELDFVLKHSQFKKYRDNQKYTEMVNPLHDGVIELLTNLVLNQLKLHSKVKTVHIGCRKPVMLGWSLISKQWMHRNEKNLQQLYLDFVLRIVRSVKAKGKVNVIIWGNYILETPFHIIADSGIHKEVNLMLESYKALNLEFDDTSLSDIGKLFPALWLAGSYKGTIESTRTMSSMIDHATNIHQLLVLSQTLVRQRVTYKGMMLMGYSRQNHFSALSELLPVAIPTMVVCLQALLKGELSTITEWTSAKLIGMETAEIPEAAWPRPLPVAEAVFPGSKVWGEVQRLENLIYEVGRVINNKVAQQYLNVGKEQHKYVKVLPELQSFRGKLAVEMMKLQQKRQTVQDVLNEVYFGDTIEEFLEEHVDLHLRRLNITNNKLLSILHP